MGWLWGSGGGSTDNLDSSLQDFLKKESPTGPRPSLPTATPKKSDESTTSPATSTPAASTEPEKPFVPPQSQFQDGRYAHLWKNYTPQNVLDDRGKNEQDKLRDLVDAYNDRRAGIGRIAMENCALEYMEQFECFRHPKTWLSMGTLCNAESRKFNRCYDMQSKFLKALGYLTMDERSPEEDERIQMHADKLYQQMLQQEAEIEKAEKEGREQPKFESLLSDRAISRTTASNAAPRPATSTAADVGAEDESDVWSQIKPDSRRAYEEKFAKLPAQQQEMERIAVIGELKAQSGITKKVEQTFVEERINRMKRREAGQATIGDTIKYWWGWG
ncbi:hypothetical protein FB567DRAFT_132950 [Paraphoma chrysanthemicola]|uniref:Autophagy protein n=1 Tax=Paraphoma chrysanthemicola TaxID=798071 RepID=A0A8K0QXF9_9PLEO|nr:hypothetical protein FB567DRAFT_132950 [Paraphoma chrysanthemicola]